MHQRLLALALMTALLLASCSTTHKLPMPRERVPEIVDDRTVEVVDSNGARKEVRVKGLTPSTDEEPLDPTSYYFAPYRDDFEEVLAKWERSNDWEYADMEVVSAPADQKVRFYGAVGAGVGLGIGLMLTGVNPTQIDDTYTLVGVAPPLVMFTFLGAITGGGLGAAQTPEYELAD